MTTLLPLLPNLNPKIDLSLGEGEYETYEEYATDTSSVLSTPPLTPQTPRFDHTAGLGSPASTGRLWGKTRTQLPQNRSFSTLTSSARTASTLTLSRWDWKTLFYNWSFPLDQVIMGMRRVSSCGGCGPGMMDRGPCPLDTWNARFVVLLLEFVVVGKDGSCCGMCKCSCFFFSLASSLVGLRV